MIDSSIEYKSIILRCDQIDKSAYLELDSDVEIEFYKKGMETVWTGVQKGAGEFERIIDSDVTTYFIERYGCEQDELEKRCIFLKKKSTKKYIGTCMAWFEHKGKEEVPVLHWLAIDDAYSGKGYARMLITQVLKIFEQLDAGQKIYLHTQPASYRAIKLYNDFGFCMTRTDTYGTAVNEFEDALPILKQYMTFDSYSKLLQTSIL